ncbi:Uncharacterized protein PECH_006773 [Penicillium ucsense]|uniref:HCNGP-like protein n=1 Tax=Penicillium ucsense TaxID=2839758 RepID=A0A8J8W007_9EURO|nr:Uncharacterized protein PECM_002268 [Penicillium ucsense]KAF7735360.1 Uncharacterized protein PECH_006773 [Penicillium ucsense]
MLGLGAYESSSEDEDRVRSSPEPSSAVHREAANCATIANSTSKASKAESIPAQADSTVSEPPNGPVLGPESGPAPMNDIQSPGDRSTSGRSSPFSSTRALVHDLTLPPVPNLNIPPSPPGSPNAALNAKFEHFLALKKQGVHFNAKLASSSSLRNPSLLKKMMEHAGIKEHEQYNTSLPSDIWDVSNLPQWAFKDELLKTQQEVRQSREEKNATGQRSSIEFVSTAATNK